MGEKMQELSLEVQKLMTQGGLSPEEALLQAGISLTDKAKLYDLALDSGLLKDEPTDPQQLMHMAQSLTAALDPATKKTLGTLISRVAEQAGAGTPPPEVQDFLRSLLGSEEEHPQER
ncbi:MAG: hypothetical protein PWR31_1161 [Bacillota bacterium]|nr:hypothetical protein [Bacillota bacterium]